MTLRMLDSIIPANLPPGADAYLAYVNGAWPTYPAVRARFPEAYVLSMTVSAGANAEGCDREPGDLAVTQIAAWTKRQLGRKVWRPVTYASASNMVASWAALRGAGIARAHVRLLSAHYGAGKHICGPSTCKYPGVPACDGTQWNPSAAGQHGSTVDESVLLDDFFEGDDVAISSADIRAIASEVWKIDGIVKAPDGNTTTNPYWEPANVLFSNGVLLRQLQAAVAALGAGGGAGPADVVAEVLAGLSPEQLADAIAANLGPDVGQQVIAALQARLATPAT